MTIYTETERLILRELHPADAEAMFEMDSDPEVHQFVGKNPVTNIQQIHDVIQFVRQQYIDNGIGRWAMIDKNTNAFIGWSGLKLIKEPVEGHETHYDVGYRLLRKYWGKGYATESAIAAVKYGFEVLNANELNARAEVEHKASKHVLEKAGLKCMNILKFEDVDHYWFSLMRADWEQIK